MAGVFLIVEGATEEQFYKGVFAEAFPTHYFNVVIMPTKRNTTARTHKGGRIHFDECVNNIRRFLRSSHHERLVLIYDYYGLDNSFLDGLHLHGQDLTHSIQMIQHKLESIIDDKRFRFILQVHEFEALLFSNPHSIAAHFYEESKLQELENIVQQAGDNPEAINNNPRTAPSKRLETLFPQYRKTTDGTIIAQKTGIDRMREKCHHFNLLCQEIDGL